MEDEYHIRIPQVSRSGRILKKSAKWIEAEESSFEEVYVTQTSNNKLDTFKPTSFYSDDMNKQTHFDKQNKELISKQFRSCSSHSKSASLNGNGEIYSAKSGSKYYHQKNFPAYNLTSKYLPDEGSSKVFSVQGGNENDVKYYKAVHKAHKSEISNAESNTLRRNRLLTFDKTSIGNRTKEVTSYMLWNSENRKKFFAMYQHLPLMQISEKMDEAWKALPLKEKRFWSRKAERFSLRNPTHSIGSDNVDGTKIHSNATSKDSYCDVLSESLEEHTLGIAPVDAAAHLKLLGDSLTRIGEKLLLADCEPSASGVYSVLLDSLLCSVGALLCLTREIPGLEYLPDDSFKKTLDHLAYFFPGL